MTGENLTICQVSVYSDPTEDVLLNLCLSVGLDPAAREITPSLNNTEP